MSYPFFKPLKILVTLVAIQVQLLFVKIQMGLSKFALIMDVLAKQLLMEDHASLHVLKKIPVMLVAIQQEHQFVKIQMALSKLVITQPVVSVNPIKKLVVHAQSRAMFRIHVLLEVIQQGLLGASMRMVLLHLHARIRVIVKENRLWKQMVQDLAQSRVQKIHVTLVVTQQMVPGVSKQMVLAKELVITRQIAKDNLRRVFVQL